MRMSAAFPSEFLRAADLQDRTANVIMDRVEMRDIGGDHKPVLFFQGKERGLVLNKTNVNTISAAYGDESDAWRGLPLMLFPCMVDFQGRQVQAIRVRVPPQRQAPAQQYAAPAPQQPAYAQPAAQEPPAGRFDEIPF